MRIKVALTPGLGQPFDLVDAELSDVLLPGEVRVKLVATGMCHTDLSVRDGYLPFGLPGVLGHEGAGVVEAVGPGVGKVIAGDHVVMTYPHCGLCEQCQTGRPTYCAMTQKWIFSGTGKRTETMLHTADGKSIGSAFMGQSSFSTRAITTEDGVVKVRRDVPLELLGPLGCSFQTGAGAVLRSLRVPTGSSLAIFGSGAVGLAAVMAARLAGVGTIIAVDVNGQRLELAGHLGATHMVNARSADAVDVIRSITGGRGAEYSLWATGLPDVLTQAFTCLSQTGTCGVVGVAPPGAKLSVDIYEIFKGKAIRGILAGDSVPDVLIPQLVDLYLQGRFPIDALVKYYGFSDINTAAQDLEHGTTVKPILRFD